MQREARKFLGYFVWKITILRQKILFFPILGGGTRRVHPPPESTPVLYKHTTLLSCYSSFDIINNMGCRGSWIYNYTCNS